MPAQCSFVAWRVAGGSRIKVMSIRNGICHHELLTWIHFHISRNLLQNQSWYPRHHASGGGIINITLWVTGKK